jgi:hypothetical protein
VSAFERGDHVVVSQFVRRGDDYNVSELDGWVVFYGEAVVVIANTPDWATLPADDYFTATFALDDVIVSHARATSETGASTVLTSVFLFLAALAFIGALGRYWPLFWGAVGFAAWLAFVLLIIAFFQGANRNGEDQ